MATPQTQERMTADEFLEAYPRRQDRPVWATPGSDLELWDGVVVEGEVPSYRHQETIHWIRTALEPWLRAKGGRIWYDADAKFGTHDIRRPDLMAWWSGQPFDPDHAFTAVPDLAIEIVSPQPRDVRRDREEKLVDYCAHGIPHYWIVEPLHRVFEVYLRQKAERGWLYYRRFCATSGTLKVFRDLTLDLDACWRAADG
jgi:Uma2 family endonuclease